MLCRVHVLYVWFHPDGKCLCRWKRSRCLAMAFWKEYDKHSSSQYRYNWWVCWNCCSFSGKNPPGSFISNLYLYLVWLFNLLYVVCACLCVCNPEIGDKIFFVLAVGHSIQLLAYMILFTHTITRLIVVCFILIHSFTTDWFS